MRIQVNGEEREIEAGASVRSLLEAMQLGDVLVAVERNEEIIPRAAHTTATLNEGDVVEVVHFVGGG
ncbi:MAG: sulfur carrier protein ThiS [Deltaproteobacteria bacterium]|nr:sulfur carrier protein ThiS [Deltaproteobacteria bacterium]